MLYSSCIQTLLSPASRCPWCKATTPLEQKTHTKEFKIEAVRLLESSQKSQAQIASELGVAESTLSQWRKDLAEHGKEEWMGGAISIH